MVRSPCVEKWSRLSLETSTSCREWTSCIVTCSNSIRKAKTGGTRNAEKAQRMHQGNYTSWNPKGKMLRKSITWMVYKLRTGPVSLGNPCKKLVECRLNVWNMYEIYMQLFACPSTRWNALRLETLPLQSASFYHRLIWLRTLRTLIHATRNLWWNDYDFSPFLVSLSVSSGPRSKAEDFRWLNSCRVIPCPTVQPVTGIIHCLEHQALVHRPA